MRRLTLRSRAEGARSLDGPLRRPTTPVRAAGTPGPPRAPRAGRAGSPLAPPSPPRRYCREEVGVLGAGRLLPERLAEPACDVRPPPDLGLVVDRPRDRGEAARTTATLPQQPDALVAAARAGGDRDQIVGKDTEHHDLRNGPPKVRVGRHHGGGRQPAHDGDGTDLELLEEHAMRGREGATAMQNSTAVAVTMLPVLRRPAAIASSSAGHDSSSPSRPGRA